MKSLLYVMAALAVIGLAFWAYRENYETQRVLTRAEKAQRQIGDARARLAMLKAEWAYLNRPDRLRDLAEINFGSLALLPLRPDQFGRIDQVAFPEEDSKIIFNAPVEVSSDGASQ
ncbi:cell division protein FtsL [Pseudooceanicola sp.]|uniref:cell division protein FtsL n=1 Tax=Pseudooceanicola sp. TaxID=1914328 RepID=UPI00260EEF4C|nr:cell division protein FtsL [Pseudooceanicola sp.]MDF1854393.1 cell division protein FtsL [Pseudooceanicola sp.]